MPGEVSHATATAGHWDWHTSFRAVLGASQNKVSSG
jgi:hypothetical protein